MKLYHEKITLILLKIAGWIVEPSSDWVSIIYLMLRQIYNTWRVNFPLFTRTCGVH